MQLAIVVALTSFSLSFLLCALEIPLLKKLKAGQNILSYVKEHENKGGTPTMGGLGFVFAAVLSSLAYARLSGADKRFTVAIAVGISYMLVGFLDDLFKKLRGKNLGLRAYQKILFQFAVAICACLYCCLNGLTALKIPYTDLCFDLGWWFLPFGVFVFLGTTNGVNLTDGLDGLAGSVSAAFFLFFGAILLLQGGGGGLSELSFALTGALCAYLIFNTHRASVFMGDTGSLALGGFVASLALFTGNALVIPVLGITFLLSSISVIIQVIYYKRTKKRVFLMAPIHHHFEELGYEEGKIVYAYTVITAFLGCTLLLPLVL